MEQTSMTFIHNLKHILHERNISQHELSRGTGIPQSSISGYLKGKNAPLLRQAYLICNFLDVNIDLMCNNERCDISCYTEDSERLKEIIFNYNKLNSNGREQLLSLSKSLSLNNDLNINEEKEKKSCK